MSASLPSRTKVLQSIEDVSREAWNALVPKEGFPFVSWEFLRALETSGSTASETGWHPSHLTLWEGTRLIAAAPAYRKDHSYGEFVFDWSWASAADRLGFPYYPKLLVAAPLSPATGPRLLVHPSPSEDRKARQAELGRAILDYAREAKLSSVHVLFPTKEESELLSALGYGVRLGVQYHWQNHCYRTFDDFLARFTSKRRNQVRRERKQLGQDGVSVTTYEGAALSRFSGEALHQLYGTTVDKHLYGGKYLKAGFFQSLLEDVPDRLQVVTAEKGGKVLAGAINLKGDNVLYGRYWGAFEELPFLHFNVCIYSPVEQAISRGIRRFEPGAGGEHKLVRGFEPSLTYSAHCIFHPALDTAVRKYLVHEAEAIRQGMPRLRAETGLKDSGDPGEKEEDAEV